MMKLIAPDYYEDFVCIAGACRHSCCIGWEIDIDGDTLALYREVGGSFGERLCAGIEERPEGACFRLGADGRCPFLNGDGLCDVILRLGEEALSQICTDHPRFCAFFGDRTELGLGLCCEEAARIILSRREKTSLTVLDDDGGGEALSEEERLFLEKRERIFALAQDRGRSISERMQNMLNEVQCVLPQKSLAGWIDVFLSMEQMDGAWGTLLERARALGGTLSSVLPGEWETAWEQLLCYFVYRHACDPARDIGEAVLFSVLSVSVIRSLFACLYGQGGADLGSLTELCRLYSSEIEYSEENTEKLNAFFHR